MNHTVHSDKEPIRAIWVYIQMGQLVRSFERFYFFSSLRNKCVLFAKRKWCTQNIYIYFICRLAKSNKLIINLLLIKRYPTGRLKIYCSYDNFIAVFCMYFRLPPTSAFASPHCYCYSPRQPKARKKESTAGLTE